MTKRHKAKTFTLRNDQIQYLRQRFSSPGEVSRWVRECIDVRISIELKEADRLIKHALAKGGLVPKEDDGDSLSSGVTTLSDFRATMEKQCAEAIVNTARNVPLPEGK